MQVVANAITRFLEDEDSDCIFAPNTGINQYGAEALARFVEFVDLRSGESHQKTKAKPCTGRLAVMIIWALESNVSTLCS